MEMKPCAPWGIGRCEVLGAWVEHRRSCAYDRGDAPAAFQWHQRQKRGVLRLARKRLARLPKASRVVIRTGGRAWHGHLRFSANPPHTRA